MDSHQHANHFGRAFAIGIALNLGFVLLEAFYGWKTGSLALLADAGHNLSDVAGLVLAWAAFGAARLKPNRRHTYGWRRASILASFVNATVLLVAMGSLLWEASHRLQTPTTVDGFTVIWVAGIGVIINSVTAWLFVSGSEHDLNIRGAFLHMAADALVSVGVVLGGVLTLWQGWLWIDPVVSVLIALIIIVGTWSLFHRSLHLLFDGVPDNLDLEEIEDCLLALPGVLAVHDLHVWAMSTQENALTAHLVCEAAVDTQNVFLKQTAHAITERFGIEHITLQCESPEFADQCPVCPALGAHATNSGDNE
ncbi:MAG: cation diffusion facilitator family transporter [Gammaproteobacteria bacterium]|nr:cation diffusion facilitator family transporter [Gammaproteobacteria bacterium]MDP2140563.1 cation diffusion facilitator family transporter [Gammaproteobacteria bacterium]MDP2347332.1 cation diffusion facilitator family transporter [Gammaproteobacteria bacterium]